MHLGPALNIQWDPASKTITEKNHIGVDSEISLIFLSPKLKLGGPPSKKVDH